MESVGFLPFSLALPITAGASLTDRFHEGPFGFLSVFVPAAWPANTDLIVMGCDTIDGTFVPVRGATGVVARVTGIVNTASWYAVPDLRYAPAHMKLQSVDVGGVGAAPIAAGAALVIAAR